MRRNRGSLSAVPGKGGRARAGRAWARGIGDAQRAALADVQPQHLAWRGGKRGAARSTPRKRRAADAARTPSASSAVSDVAVHTRCGTKHDASSPAPRARRSIRRHVAP